MTVKKILSNELDKMDYAFNQKVYNKEFDDGINFALGAVRHMIADTDIDPFNDRALVNFIFGIIGFILGLGLVLFVLFK